MYDLEKITKTISDIEKFKRELTELHIHSLRDVEDAVKRHAGSMLCFAILNRVLDLGEHILIAEKRGMPSRYADIFPELVKAGLINAREAEEFNELIRYRNIIAHTYFLLSAKDIFKLVKSINTIEPFLEKIKKRIQKR